MREQTKWWALYPVSWPDYLFRVIYPNYYEAVHGANVIIAVQLRRRLQWGVKGE